MVLEKLIPLIIIVLAIVIAWAIFKRLFKLLFYAGIIIILLIAATSYFIYKDIADLKDNFGDSTKKIILVDKEKVLTGFLLDEEVNFLTNEQLDEFSSHLKDNDFEKILGSSYKLMVFDLDMVSDLDTEEIEIGDKLIPKDFAISVLKSNNPFSMLKDKKINEDDLEITKNDINDNAKVKAALFGNILSNHILSSKNPLFFFSEFKKGNIVIYPETALFKTAKLVPLSFIKNTGKKIFSKTKETAKTLVVEAVE